MKQLTLAAAITLLAAPLLAGQCLADIAAIDAALAAGTELSEADLATVQELRDEGQSLHDAGDHDASVQTLAEAKAMLGI
ncbi:hypothetical protein D1822_11775 [Phaeobacter inhibens]|uniref:hypothetical protein n=1 Tax=Phaeobacter inhibens TaxID=221822 RepID=UPI0001632980|nr:hypothetical protein [Phaeobacter inhibens]AFO92092.1 hypothetical protein PGA1_c24070 [Phaeobacter inhibens DSM 17395]AUQ46774.1 hypothetical protein PhaeoP10_02447 [Phaeobacter inhibens]AUQ63270.1 hypothetical protein PhaeoP51_02302 [Phaeobacter inhibens]AUQ83176.1 hypothetical protein PhaeoP57_02263 [Phaeobacter inhibens]AUQ90935.1 hypothetical protein PhaeoP24_02335 [Phaeobacter inhibens]